MSEVILVSNNPHINELKSSSGYKIVGSIHGKTIIHDFADIRALCDVDENDRLKYVDDFRYFQSKSFVKNLQTRFNTFWIDQIDLLDYNQYVNRTNVGLEEFMERVLQLKKELSFVPQNLDHSEYLWAKMTPQQRAKVMPLGYLRNYIRYYGIKAGTNLDVLILMQRTIKDHLEFGMPSS